MSNTDKAKLSWAARRGMLELDIFLMPFVEHIYETLTKSEQDTFKLFISSTDMELYHWLTEKEPAPAEYQDLVYKIIHYARDSAKSKRQ